MVRVLVSAETMERLMAHHGAFRQAQKLIAQALLAEAKAGFEPGDSGQVGQDDGEIGVAHAWESLFDIVSSVIFVTGTRQAVPVSNLRDIVQINVG
jgi:hypothetical protein